MRSVLTLSTAGVPNRSIGRQAQRKGTSEIVSCEMPISKLLPVPPGALDRVCVITVAFHRQQHSLVGLYLAVLHLGILLQRCLEFS